MDAEVELVDPPSMRERFACPTRKKREAHEVPADDCQWHDDFIGILDSFLKSLFDEFQDENASQAGKLGA